MQKPDWLIVRRPGSPVLFFVAVLMIIAVSWGTDHNSCIRGQGVRDGLNYASSYFAGAANRSALRATVDTGAARGLDLQAAAAAWSAAAHLRVHQLDCSLFPPPTH